MRIRYHGKLPGALSERRDQIDFIVEFWNALRSDDDFGSTTWEVLDDFERQVSECLDSEPPDIDGAEHLTARAMLMMSGKESL
ncbi:MAG: hypothetical protein R6U98_29270 [Pirellulaceae bacterium]